MDKFATLLANGLYKAILGPHLRARRFSGQQAKAAIYIAILNRMLDAGRTDSVRLVRTYPQIMTVCLQQIMAQASERSAT